MSISTVLEKLFKRIFLLSALVMVATFFHKDKMPMPDFYDLNSLNEPSQNQTDHQPFETVVNEQSYTIDPKFDYELYGVVVSYNNAGSFGDIWHHKRWKDFLNLRDLCVIWGKNVATGIYNSMEFRNDSWTCSASWFDNETGSIFSMTELSNNHILTDNDSIKSSLMEAEVGDHIRFRGYLASYSNKVNGFNRGTSITRSDTGNGACETIFLDDFEIIKKANSGTRKIYSLAKWLTITAFIGFIITLTVAPVRLYQ